MDARIEIRKNRFINVRLYKNPNANTTIFLIHGLGGRGEQWREQINLLKNQYTLVIADLLGHGLSDKPKPYSFNPYQFAEFDQDLQSLFHRFSGEKNILMGHSYGGALATSLAIDHQDNINALILIAPLPCEPKQKIPLIYQCPTFVLTLLRPWLEKNFQQLAFDKEAPRSLLTSELQAGKINPMYVIRSMLHGLKFIPHLDVTMLGVPTLLIHGEHDGIVPVSEQRAFYGSLPHSQIMEVQHASHMVMLEKPSVVNQMITTYLTP